MISDSEQLLNYPFNDPKIINLENYVYSFVTITFREYFYGEGGNMKITIEPLVQHVLSL